MRFSIRSFALAFALTAATAAIAAAATLPLTIVDTRHTDCGAILTVQTLPGIEGLRVEAYRVDVEGGPCQIASSAIDPATGASAVTFPHGVLRFRLLLRNTENAICGDYIGHLEWD